MTSLSASSSVGGTLQHQCEDHRATSDYSQSAWSTNITYPQYHHGPQECHRQQRKSRGQEDQEYPPFRDCMSTRR